MEQPFTYRASLALFDASGELQEVASRDIATMDGGELDSWLGELVAAGQLVAERLAADAIGEGLAFGNSNSRRDFRHVANLVLSDAARLQSAAYMARREAEKVAA